MEEQRLSRRGFIVSVAAAALAYPLVRAATDHDGDGDADEYYVAGSRADRNSFGVDAGPYYAPVSVPTRDRARFVGDGAEPYLEHPA